MPRIIDWLVGNLAFFGQFFQVRGIQQMLADHRDCRDVVTQIAAANKALEQVGFHLVAAGLTWCLTDREGSAAAGYELGDVQRMFLKLA